MTFHRTISAVVFTALMGCPTEPHESDDERDGSMELLDAASQPRDGGLDKARDASSELTCDTADAEASLSDGGQDAGDDPAPTDDVWWDPGLSTVAQPLAGACDLTAARYISGSADTNYVARPGERQPGTCNLVSLYEPNDVAGTACSVLLGERISSELSGGPDTADFYGVRVRQGRTYTLLLTRTATLVRLVNMPVGTDAVTYLPSATLGGSGTTAETFTADRDGTVLIRLSGSGTYSFRLVPSTNRGLLHDNLSFEPNDAPSIAAPLCVGTQITSEALGPNDRDDFFTAQLDASASYTLKLHRIATVVRGITMGSGDQLRNVLPSATFGGSGTTFEDFVPPVSGLATLEASGGPCDVAILPGTDFGLVHDQVTFEPNDSPNLAMPLALGSTVSSEFGSSDDIADVFRVSVVTGTSYTLHLTRLSTLTRSAFLVRDSEQVSALSQVVQGGSGTTHESFTAPSSGILYIRLSGGQGTTYTLQLSSP